MRGGKFQNRVNYPGHVTGECAGRSTQYVTARGVNREGGEWHLHAVGPEKRESLDNLKPGIHHCVLYTYYVVRLLRITVSSIIFFAG